MTNLYEFCKNKAHTSYRDTPFSSSSAK